MDALFLPACRGGASRKAFAARSVCGMQGPFRHRRGNQIGQSGKTNDTFDELDTLIVHH